MKKNNRKGFTITELVIVIAVIAILAAVLIPTFSGIIGKANDSKTLQEARNLMVSYTADKDAAVPTEYYIQVGDANAPVYYKVTNGQLSDTKEAANFVVPVGKTIVSKDTDGDGWPESVVATAPANPG